MSSDPRSTADISISASSAKTLKHDSDTKSPVPEIDAVASADKSSESADALVEVEGEEEEGECGFCVFMKGGGCKDTFVAWEECIESAEKGKEDIAEKCYEVTSLLRKCMEAHAGYYEPVLRAEKVAEEVATIEVEKEKMAEKEEEEKKVQKDGGLDLDVACSSGKQDAAA
ncbi:hypothetical protein QQ045_017952 [Rhodiola kirilowii]